MPCCTSRFHSAYLGLLTLLATELKLGEVQGVVPARVLNVARFPPVANALWKAVLQPATMAAAFPGNPGARTIGVPGVTVKLVLSGAFKAKVSNSDPG